MTHRCRSHLPFWLAFLSLGSLTSALAQEPTEAFSDTLKVTAVDVIVDVRNDDGEVPENLTVADFEVLEDGESRPVVAVESLGRTRSDLTLARETTGSGVPTPAEARSLALGDTAWQFVLYFDLPLSARRSVKDAALALAEQATALTGLGTVEIVVADPLPERRLEATRDPAAVTEALKRISKKERGREELSSLRQQFIREADADDMADTLVRQKDRETSGPSPGTPGAGPTSGSGTIIVSPGADNLDSQHHDAGGRAARQRMAMRGAVTLERRLLTRQRVALTDYLAAVARIGPRALLLVNDGFDTDPADFYLSQFTDPSQISSLRSELLSYNQGPAVEQLSQLLAASGWTLMPVATGGLVGQSTTEASESGHSRYRAHGRDSRSFQSLSSFLVHHPIEPLDTFATTTGGELILSADDLPGSVSRLGERLRLTYQVPRPPDGRILPIEVRSTRPGVQVTAPLFASAASPDALSAARSRTVLASGEPGGTLPVTVTSRADLSAPSEDGAWVGVLEIEVDLTPLADLREWLEDTSLRLTFAVALPDGRIFVSHEVVAAQDLSHATRWRYEAPIRLPPGSPKLAVVVDELTYGHWGGAPLEL